MVGLSSTLPPMTRRLHASRPLNQFMWISAAGIIIQAVFLILALVSPNSGWTVLCMYSLPMVPLLVGLCSLSAARQSEASVGKWPLGTGFLVIIGGAGFDLFATLWNSPDLSSEANVPLRILLDSRHSLQTVYIYGLIVNILFTTLFCILWWAILKHVRVVAQAIEEHHPESLCDFLKAATGGGHLTIRQWLWPLRLSELPLLYFWIWPTIAAVIGSASALRWYAGLEWFNVVSASLAGRAIVLTSTAMLTLVAYFFALHRILQSRHAQSDCAA